MEMGLAGRRAMVTGSSAGLGRAIAEMLAAEGASVVVHGRDWARTQAVADAIEARGGQAFNPFGKGTMGYYSLPEDILEDAEELRDWVRAALAVARKKKGSA